MRSQTRPRERRYKALYPPNRNGCAGHENTRIETYFVRRDLSSSGWADRSAEDRRLRKAEAVGSNPTRSTSTRRPVDRSTDHESKGAVRRNSGVPQVGWKGRVRSRRLLSSLENPV